MTISTINRRAALAAPIGLAIVAAACGRESGPEETDAAAAPSLGARLSRLIYPHDLDDAVFENVAAAIDGAPAFKEAVAATAALLDQNTSGTWLTLSDDAQIAALKEIEQTPAFAGVLFAVTSVLYNQPQVWALIGFEGPSAHLGGYRDRGFDDIDWLPEGD